MASHAFREVPRSFRDVDPGLSALAPQLHLRLHPARVVERADAQEGDRGHARWIDGYRRTAFRAEISPTNRAITRSQREQSYRMSVAWLWRDQGEAGRGSRASRAVYGWFTEGFDTRDLKEAKALLDELA